MQDERLLHLLRRLPRPVWVLFVGQFLNRFGTFVQVFLIIWLIDLGYSPQQAGLAVASYGAGSLAAALVGGQLADRVGRRRTIALSMFSSALAMVALEQATTLGPAVVGAFAIGLCAELYRPASLALLTDLVDDRDRVVAFAGWRFAINLGFAFGPAVAGFLATRSFTWLFYGDAASSVLFGILALVMLPEGETSDAESDATLGSWSVLARDRRFLLFLGAAMLNGLIFVQAFSTFAVHVTDNGLTEADYGLLLSFNGLVIVLLELPIVKWSRIRPHTPVMVIGLLLLGAGFGLTALATTMLMLALTVSLWTLGEMVVSPVASAHVAHISPTHLRGRYAGAVSLAFGVANILGPAGGTAVYGASPTLLWGLCAVLSVAAAALMVVSERVGRADRRAAALAARQQRQQRQQHHQTA